MVRGIVPLGAGEGKVRPKLKAVGIGGAGCNAIAGCAFDAVAICNSRDNFSTGPHHRRLVLSPDQIGILCSTSPRLLGTIGHEGARKLKEAIGENDLLFIFTGLGGETGSKLTPGVAHFARSFNGFVVVSAALPFSVEGKGRQDAAAQALPEIIEAAHLTITYPNDGLLKLAPNLPLRRAFKVMDSIMTIPAAELAQILTRDDLAALRADPAAVKHMRFGMGQGSGVRKEEAAVADALTSPWFDFPLDRVRTALVIISAEAVDEYAVKAVADALSSRVPEARVRYSAKADPALGDKMRLMLLLGCEP